MKVYPTCVLLFACAHAVAAEPRVIEHVLVTAPLHKTTAETAMPLRALTGDELRRAAASTIGETLMDMPGIANASFGPGVGQPVIRGQQGPRVMVLQNGTSSADASSLSADHAVAVESMLADSIEVLRGPSTLLYGGGAIGGVVNVIDSRVPVRRAATTTGGIEYRRDTAADMDVAVLRLDTGRGDYAFHVDGLYRSYHDLEIPGSALGAQAGVSDEAFAGAAGTIENTAGEAQSLTVGGSYHFARGFAGLSVARLENEYGIPAGAHAAHHHDEEAPGDGMGDHDDHDAEEEQEGGIVLDVEQTRYDAVVHLHQPVPGFEVARLFATYTDYAHSEIEGDGAVGTRYLNESWEGRLELVHNDIGPFHGVLGVQARSGKFSALGEEAFIPVTEAQDLGLFWLEDYHEGNWTFEAGLRLDIDERNPAGASAPARDFTALSASASALWTVAADWQLGLFLSRAERAPAIEELYSNVEASGPANWVLHAATSALELGDPALDTEVSHNVDLALRWHNGANRASLNVFYNRFTDYINLSNTGQESGGDPVLAYVQGDADFYGLEFDSEFALGTLAGGSLIAAFYGDAMRGELRGGDNVPRLPPLRAGARFSWETPRLELWTRAQAAADQNRPGANEGRTRGYLRWDLGLEFSPRVAHGDLNLFLSLNNILDEEIRLSTSFLREQAPEAGISIEAGLRYLL